VNPYLTFSIRNFEYSVKAFKIKQTLYISIENTEFFINFTEKLSNSEDAYLAKMQKCKKIKKKKLFGNILKYLCLIIKTIFFHIIPIIACYVIG
jgi:hypothetical protein